LGLFAQTGNGLDRLAEVHHDYIGDPDLPLLGDFIASADITKITLIVHRVVQGR